MAKRRAENCGRHDVARKVELLSAKQATMLHLARQVGLQKASAFHDSSLPPTFGWRMVEAVWCVCSPG